MFEKTPEGIFVRLLCKPLKLEPFGLIRAFGVFGQPEKGRFFLAERPRREALGIIDGETIDNNYALSPLADKGLWFTNINRVRLSHFHLV